MAQITALIAGPNKNFDYQVTAPARTILNPGVTSSADLLVSLNSVAVGEAFLLCTRSNGQKIMTHFQNTAAVTIDTSGTKKVWVGISQEVIDDGSSNAIDGTGIATIQTGASYPSTGAYIPLASITGGVITDERVMISGKPILQEGFEVDKHKVINRATGKEELKDVTDLSPEDTDVIRMRKADGNYNDSTFGTIKNELSSAGKYLVNATLAESVPAGGIVPFTAQSLVTLFGTLTYQNWNYQNPSAAFDVGGGGWNAGYALSAPSIGYGEVVGIPNELLITNIGFTSQGQYGVVTVTVKGIKSDGSQVTLGTSSSPNAALYTHSMTVTDTNRFIGFRFEVTEAGNGSRTINDVKFTGNYIVQDLSAVAIVGSVKYKTPDHTTSGATSIANIGVRFTPTKNCKLGVVKSFRNASSSSASFILYGDNFTTPLTTKSVANGQNSADMDYDLVAGTVYRLVVNDCANFTGYSYVSNAVYVASFPYSVTGTQPSSTTDPTNAYSFNEINIDFGNKAYLACAKSTVEPQFAKFSGFVTGPKSAGDTVSLDANNGSIASGFVGMIDGLNYYVSNAPGVIAPGAGTVPFSVGEAKGTTNIMIGSNKLIPQTITVGGASNGGVTAMNVFLPVKGKAKFEIWLNTASASYAAQIISASLAFSRDGVNILKQLTGPSNITTTATTQTLMYSIDVDFPEGFLIFTGTLTAGHVSYPATGYVKLTI